MKSPSCTHCMPCLFTSRLSLWIQIGWVHLFSLILFFLWPVQSYEVRASSQQCSEAGDVCAICQADFKDPIALMCQVRGVTCINELKVMHRYYKDEQYQTEYIGLDCPLLIKRAVWTSEVHSCWSVHSSESIKCVFLTYWIICKNEKGQ